jgi:catechol 2,3-dioxygenase-like lactoylglutathione lyase family enzyme
MKRVTGIGGIFIKSENPERLRAWYRDHLGFDLADWGGSVFHWNAPDAPTPGGATVWSIFDKSSKYFEPSTAPFMVNYRVDNLEQVLAALREEGCDVDEKTEDSEMGKFGWVMDPDGNRVELWQPPAYPIDE